MMCLILNYRDSRFDGTHTQNDAFMPSKKRSYPSTKTVVYDGILGPPLSVCHHSDLRHQNYLKLVPLSAASVESMVCHLSVTHPHLQEVCTCLVWENSMYVLTFALGLCRSICFFLSPPVCFPQFCMVLPSFLHSLPRLNGLERGVCHLSAPPICKMYAPVLCGKLHVDLHFWLALLHFSLFFSWVLESSRVFSTTLHASAFIFA